MDELNETAIGRKMKRLKEQNNLLWQAIYAYRHAINNPGDPVAWKAVGSAEAALKFHKESAAEVDIAQWLEQVEGAAV